MRNRQQHSHEVSFFEIANKKSRNVDWNHGSNDITIDRKCQTQNSIGTRHWSENHSLQKFKKCFHVFFSFSWTNTNRKTPNWKKRFEEQFQIILFQCTTNSETTHSHMNVFFQIQKLKEMQMAMQKKVWTTFLRFFWQSWHHRFETGESDCYRVSTIRNNF